MVVSFLALAAVFLGVVVTLQVRSYRKLKTQTHLMLIQSQEIIKQMQELQQQNKMLEDLNNEKQQIIGVVSHDLKGPFNRIFALTQLMSLSRKNLDDDQKEYLGKIHQIVADGLGMVRNLLDNRRLEEKGIDLAPENVNIPTTMASMIKNYRVLADKKKIQIHFESPPQLFLMVDKVCLNRIMDNLLSNAIKFSPSETNIHVTVSEQDDEVQIAVKDEGQGLTPEDQAKLFQKYQRLTPRPTAGESSTGLGLFLIKAMVNRLGGQIVCKSQEGKGAAFIVQLKKGEVRAN